MQRHFVAVYRPNDGHVMHLHMVHVVERGRQVPREEAEAEAKTRAAAAGHNVAVLKFAYAETLEPAGRYKVDVASGKIIPDVSDPKALDQAARSRSV